MKKLNRKSIQYGSASLTLTLVFIAFAAAINLIVGFVTERFNLYVDMTPEQLYTLSDETKSLLADRQGDVSIIFLTPLDELDDNAYTKSVKSLALEYEKQFPGITVQYVDMIKNPTAVARYRKETDKLSSTSVIVESPRRFTVFDMSSCFVYEKDSAGNLQYYAFNGEYRFTAALLKVCRENLPKAVFTANHGEDVPTYFKSMFTDSGFEVVTLDLGQEEIPEDTEILIINGPTKDLTGMESEEAGISEITRLSSYLNRGGDAMVFLSPETPALKNLDDLLRARGIEPLHGYAVTDEKNHVASMDTLAVIASFAGDDTVKPMSDKVAKSEVKTVSYNTMPLSLTPVTDVSAGVSALLASSPTAKVYKTEKELLLSDRSVALMAVAYRNTYNSDTGLTDTNYLLVGGSTYFTSDVFLGTYADTYLNGELLKGAVTTMTDETMVLNVPSKPYNDTTLTVDNATRNKWLAGLVTVLPLLVLLVSLAVFMKRRHQ